VAGTKRAGPSGPLNATDQTAGLLKVSIRHLWDQRLSLDRAESMLFACVRFYDEILIIHPATLGHSLGRAFISAIGAGCRVGDIAPDRGRRVSIESFRCGNKFRRVAAAASIRWPWIRRWGGHGL
jgi:hypothetical protein